MTDPDGLPRGLAEVFEAVRQRRAARVVAAFQLWRPYERRIVKEAAVMGYVLGRQDGLIIGRSGRSILNDRDGFPGDAKILQDVIEHCDTSSDTYPYIGQACDGRRRRITRGRQWPGEFTPEA